MPIKQSCNFAKERFGLPSDRELAVAHLVALQPNQKTHPEQRYIEVFDDSGGNVIDRKLVDPNLPQHHWRHPRRAVGSVDPGTEHQTVEIDAGSTRIRRSERDEARAGIDEQPDGSPIDRGVNNDMTTLGCRVDNSV